LSGLKNVFLVSPLAYTEFVALLTHSVLVITDSGGIQEESVSLGKRVLVTRKITEREEGVESGLLKIVSTDSDAIFEFASRILKNPTPDKIPKINPFGEGNISKRIVDKILGT
jgi:UDP-N-acetylglucosamine 2-epimerase (non-hydrolysing)